MLIKKIFISIIFMVFSYGNTFCNDFLFTIDNKLINEPFSNIPEHTDLKNNKWFMGPVSRLEMLINVMDQNFKKDFYATWEYYKEDFELYFEKNGSYSDISPTVGVSFEESKGLICVIINISSDSKPKLPMKELCDEIYKRFYLKALMLESNLRKFVINNKSRDEVQNILSQNMLFAVNLSSVINGNLCSLCCYNYFGEKNKHYQKLITKIP